MLSQVLQFAMTAALQRWQARQRNLDKSYTVRLLAVRSVESLEKLLLLRAHQDKRIGHAIANFTHRFAQHLPPTDVANEIGRVQPGLRTLQSHVIADSQVLHDLSVVAEEKDFHSDVAAMLRLVLAEVAERSRFEDEREALARRRVHDSEDDSREGREMQLLMQIDDEINKHDCMKKALYNAMRAMEAEFRALAQELITHRFHPSKVLKMLQSKFPGLVDTQAALASGCGPRVLDIPQVLQRRRDSEADELSPASAASSKNDFAGPAIGPRLPNPSSSGRSASKKGKSPAKSVEKPQIQSRLDFPFFSTNIPERMMNRPVTPKRTESFSSSPTRKSKKKSSKKKSSTSSNASPIEMKNVSPGSIYNAPEARNKLAAKVAKKSAKANDNLTS